MKSTLDDVHAIIRWNRKRDGLLQTEKNPKHVRKRRKILIYIRRMKRSEEL